MKFRFWKINRRREKGLSMMEVALAITVLAIAMAGISQMIATNTKTLRARGDAEKIETISKASQNYLVANQAALLTATSSGSVVAIPIAKTCASCASPTAPAGFSSVQDDGFLPASFIDANSSGKQHALLVRQTATGDLDAIVTSYGGRTITDENLSALASILGASGGGVYSNSAFASTSEITGTQGGWGDNVAAWSSTIGGTSVTPSSGNVAVSLGLASLAGANGSIDESKFLHRDAQSDTSLNAMNTPLSMNGNSITSVNTLQATNYLRGTQFLDHNNTTYRVDPNGTGTRLNGVRIDGATSLYNTLTSSSSATFSGNVSGNQGIFSGAVSGTTGTFSGAVSGTTGTFSSDVSGTNGTFSGTVRGTQFLDQNNTTYRVDPTGTGTRLNGVRIDGATSLYNTLTSSSSATFSGNVSGNQGIFSGAVSGTNGTFSGTVSGNAGSFSGSVTTGGNTTVSGNVYANHANITTTIAAGGNITSGASIIATQNVQGVNLIAGTQVQAPKFVASSDRRLKENIEDLDGAPLVMQLEAKSYNMKASGEKSMGFIAQDVEKFAPDVVYTDPETGMKGIDYISLIAPMVDTMQEMQAEIDALRDEVAELRAAQ